MVAVVVVMLITEELANGMTPLTQQKVKAGYLIHDKRKIKIYKKETYDK